MANQDRGIRPLWEWEGHGSNQYSFLSKIHYFKIIWMSNLHQKTHMNSNLLTRDLAPYSTSMSSNQTYTLSSFSRIGNSITASLPSIIRGSNRSGGGFQGGGRNIMWTLSASSYYQKRAASQDDLESFGNKKRKIVS